MNKFKFSKSTSFPGAKDNAPTEGIIKSFSLPPLEKMVVDAIDSLDKINFTSEDIKNSKSNLVRFYSKSKLDSKLENALNELIKLNLIKRCDESTFEKLWDSD